MPEQPPPIPASDEAQAKPSGRLLALLSLAVLAIAIAGYWATGWPALLKPGATGQISEMATAAAAAEAASGATPQQQIAAMVDKLAERMQRNPDDAEGWTMLARSYTVLGRFADALPAYARASELRPNDAKLLADYADAVAASKGTVDNPQSAALVERSLKIEPNHPKALALAGAIAYGRGDFAGAAARWQKFADQLPPGSELLERVQASIAEARQRAAGNGAPGAPASSAALASTAAPASAVRASGRSAVSGVVTLDPALAGRVAPGDSLFVFARPASGGRAPLAVFRATAKDLPLSFTLDDSMAMAPGHDLSSASEVTIGARISKSGNAIPQPGDLAGETSGVTPGAKNVAVKIGTVVGDR